MVADRSTAIIPLIAVLTNSRASLRLALAILLAILVAAGCQSVPASYAQLTEAIASGETVSPEQLRAGFLASPDYAERMERLNDLELQAYAILEDEPLKLGSLGSAILDTNYGSLTGHYVLAHFYRYVENADATRLHEDWIERVRASMRASGTTIDGTEYVTAITPVEAQVYAQAQGLTPVGSIYQTSEALPFSLMLQARTAKGNLEVLHFDLEGLYQGMRTTLGVPPDDTEFAPLNLVGFLAREGDSAAQAAVGAFLASQGQFDEAGNWLRAASRTGNLVANSLLARLYWERARDTEDADQRETYLDEALENYLHAVAVGSTDAMYALAILYLNGHFGPDQIDAGIDLLRQAGALDHADSLLFLGHLHYAGEGVERDLDAAHRYYVRAAELGSATARRSYARFLLDRSTGQPGDPRALEWLRELADGDDTDAMLLLGNLTARGLGTRANPRAAIRWFERAVTIAPQAASLVNEIAWTLSVSETRGLRRPEYARKIMDRLMNADPDARARPEYLDTWAATYAATGDFERAVTLQEEAISAARRERLSSVEPVLEEHLTRFKAGETVSEAVP